MSNLKGTTEDLRHAYRLLLGREPDDAGFTSLKNHVQANRPSAPEIAALFFASAEFKSRHDVVPVLDEIDFDGLKLYPWRGDNLIGDLVKSAGKYEAYMLPVFVESVPVGGVVLDVGANIGIYTLSAARKVGDKGQVFAVEPISRNVQSICAGVVSNGFSQRQHSSGRGVGGSRGRADLASLELFQRHRRRARRSGRCG
jgi:hypothetical protein